MPSPSGEMFATQRVASCRDVDGAEGALSEVFLPVRLRTARPSRTFEMKLNALKVGRLTCGCMAFREAVHIESAEATHNHIDIPTGGRATMRAGLASPIRGTPHTAEIFMPGRPMQIDSSEGFAQTSSSRHLAVNRRMSNFGRRAADASAPAECV